MALQAVLVRVSLAAKGANAARHFDEEKIRVLFLDSRVLMLKCEGRAKKKQASNRAMQGEPPSQGKKGTRKERKDNACIDRACTTANHTRAHLPADRAKFFVVKSAEFTPYGDINHLFTSQ